MRTVKEKFKALTGKWKKSSFKERIFHILKAAAWSFALFLLWYSFRAPVEPFINLYLVKLSDAIFTHADQNGIAILFCLIVVASVYYVCKLNRYKRRLNLHIHLVLLAFLVIMLYYRCTGKWEYVSAFDIPKFKYYDTMLLLLAFYIIGPVWPYIREVFNKTESQPLSKGFLLDLPANEDKLSISAYAKAIADQILNTSWVENKLPLKQSLAIGITGEWGSGKTTFMNLVLKAIKEKDGRAIVIRFNPWRYQNASNLTINLFEEFQNSLKPYDTKLAHDLTSYAVKLIEAVDNPYTSLVAQLNRLMFPAKTSEEQYNVINDAIISINRNIIVCIDDLDRMDKAEITEVLKLIRNNANFSKVCYLVCYDRRYVESALGELINYNPDKYLEKIFQSEIRLPSHDRKAIEDLFFNILNERYGGDKWTSMFYENGRPVRKSEDVGELLNEIFIPGKHSNSGYSKESIVSVLSLNIRDCYRFVNSFDSIYQKLKGEVSFIDLFQVELFRLKFPSVYDDFLTNPDNASKILEWPEFIGMPKASFPPNTILVLPSFNKQPHEDRKLIKELKASYKAITKEDIETIVNSLEIIFSDSKRISQLSIVYPQKMPIYSSYRLTYGNISYVEFEKKKDEGREALLEKIKFWIDEGSSEDLQKLLYMRKKFGSREDFETILTALVYFSEYNTEKSTSSWHGIDSAYWQELALEQSIVRLYESQEDQLYKLFTDLFTSPIYGITTFYARAEIIRTMYKELFEKDKEVHTTWIPHEKDELKEKLDDLRVGNLRKHLETREEATEATWFLYRRCHIANGNLNNPKVNPKAVALMKEWILKTGAFETVISKDNIAAKTSRFDLDSYHIKIAELFFGSEQAFYNAFNDYYAKNKNTPHQSDKLHELNTFFSAIQNAEGKSVRAEFIKVKVL